MEYGSKALYRHNRKTAKAGDSVTIGPAAMAAGFLKAAVGTLTHKQMCGSWWANVNGEEWCVGGGYDFKIVA